MGLIMSDPMETGVPVPCMCSAHKDKAGAMDKAQPGVGAEVRDPEALISSFTGAEHRLLRLADRAGSALTVLSVCCTPHGWEQDTKRRRPNPNTPNKHHPTPSLSSTLSPSTPSH